MSYINKCDGLTAANLQDDMGIGDFMKYLDSFLSDFLKSLNKIRISWNSWVNQWFREINGFAISL